MIDAELLDIAASAREVAMLTALVLMATEGDGEEALTMLDGFEGIAEPRAASELDARTLSQSAIRAALQLRAK